MSKKARITAVLLVLNVLMVGSLMHADRAAAAKSTWAQVCTCIQVNGEGDCSIFKDSGCEVNDAATCGGTCTQN